ncbi:hypothetical protein SAMD00019534_022530 [Acytostelium subglobosum LB1]|uniref:hypothetical protein n=1 Tax=Acytostelium subglobosum LB1 TaxID=1410327 RepID=UPI000644B7E5|nr:hypothetical protein SAMD00019534_022530 [Acytostelium subglobosum LB1]GAM19078.1 hypothetical protein SAMD00019534_022530 [Acytostelium subglobosum LB1]|eukprot:XP_012757005.1 hypothetical protein SAMD00019534_022530 [Acytostelium subglobosum LB1]
MGHHGNGGAPSVAKSHKIGDMNLHTVKQIAEGGFSYVYLVKDNQSSKQYALKRILVRDEEDLEFTMHEIHIMERLRNHKNIVRYIDHQHSSSTNEVFILMEFCAGGHLVDLMTKRQQNKFSENEVLAIFSDVCEAVAHMHSQSPPIIHRDLKVENVLLDEESSTYKLCDFGSAIQEVVHLNNKSDMQAAEDNIAKYTTMQYRPPEMIDLYRSKVLDEKVDIWALGCLLYKLLFYTTPFEDGGSLGILNGNYTIPPSNYSDELIALIRYMLHPDVQDRPDIYYIANQVSKMRGKPALFPGKGQQYISNPFSSQSTKDRDMLVTPIIHEPAPTQSQLMDADQNGSSMAKPKRHSWNMGQQQTTFQQQQQQQQQQTRPTRSREHRFPSGTHPSPNIIQDFKMEMPPAISIESHSTTDDITHLVILLTNTESTFDMDSFSKLSKSNNSNNGKLIMADIMKRPLREPTICFKALLLVHKLIISESSSASSFKSSCYESKDLFNNLYLGWLKQREKLLFVSDFLSHYSLLMYKLIQFYHKYSMIGGAFDSMDSTQQQQRWPIILDQSDSTSPYSVACITSLMSILEIVLQTQHTISDEIASNHTVSTIPLPLIQFCTNLLNHVSYSMYNYICSTLSTMLKYQQQTKNDVALTPSITRINMIFHNLREQYTKLVSLAPFSKMSFPTLALPPNPLSTPHNAPTMPIGVRPSSNPFDKPVVMETPYGGGPSVSQPHSPVQARKGNLAKYHSVSMEDARLSNTAPSSPSYTTMSPMAMIEQLSIQQQQQQGHLQVPSLQPAQQHKPRRLNPFDPPGGKPAPQLHPSPSFKPTNSGSSSINTSSNMTLVPPPARLSSNARGHRRSQSCSTDEMRKRQLMHQQQLEEGKEFRNQVKYNTLTRAISQSECAQADLLMMAAPPTSIDTFGNDPLAETTSIVSGNNKQSLL